MRYNILLLVFLFIGTQLSAQNTNDNSGDVFMFTVHYKIQEAGGDLAERFGRSTAIGASFDYLTTKNFIFGATGSFQYGIDVKEDVLASLRDSNGDIIGSNSGIASVVLRQRGLYLGAEVGKLFPLSKKRRSGIRFTVGAGFLQHKIRVQDDTNSVPQVDGEYIKGYDRLSNGLALSQFIGYQIMSNNRKINMYIGIEATQGFTQNRRSFNFDTMTIPNGKRMDTFIGLKLGWTILSYFRSEDVSEIYY